jgi:signal transduction histidine kinase
MEQMILALVVNAIEATEQDGNVSVSVRHDEDAGGIVLTVTDDGRGIPPENLANIFEPFFSTKEQTYGAGLGLAVVYGIVNRHHGEIDVDSEPGIGTKFIVRLPARQPTETEEVADDLPEITS